MCIRDSHFTLCRRRGVRNSQPCPRGSREPTAAASARPPSRTLMGGRRGCAPGTAAGSATQGLLSTDAGRAATS
eukprot:4074061-Alexandrium_andersonii.AAC.1